MVKKYEVLDSKQLARVADTGGLENYYKVRIKTAGGTVLSVDIPESDYTPERVKELLTRAAENNDEILKSGG